MEPAEAAEVAHEDAERLRQIHMVESATAATEASFTVSVIRRALLRIPQHVVRLGDLLDPLFGVLRAVVAVGVVRHRQLAICLLDLVVGRCACNAENRVKIGHEPQSSRSLSSRDVWLTSEMTLS